MGSECYLIRTLMTWTFVFTPTGLGVLLSGARNYLNSSARILVWWNKSVIFVWWINSATFSCETCQYRRFPVKMFPGIITDAWNVWQARFDVTSVIFSCLIGEWILRLIWTSNAWVFLTIYLNSHRISSPLSNSFISSSLIFQ